MAAFLKFLSRFFAILCAILFVVTAIIALLLFSLERRVFDPDTYKQALLDQNIYERMPAILGGILSSSQSFNPCNSNPIACGLEERSPEAAACFEDALGTDVYADLSQNKRTPTDAELKSAQPCIDQYNEPQQPQGGPPAYLNNLTARDWETIIAIVLPPEELKAMTEQAFDQIFAYLNGEVNSAQLSMIALKKRLAGRDGTNAVLALMNAQPACTQEQTDRMTANPSEENQEVEICRPPADKVPSIEALIQTQLRGALSRIPDQVTLLKPEAAGSSGGTPLKGIGLARLIMRLFVMIPLMFLLGVTIFVVRSLVTWLKWWGWPLLLTGLFVSIFGFISFPLIDSFLPKLIAARIPASAPAILVKTSGQLAGAVAYQILKPIGWEGLILTIIGLAMIIYAAYAMKKEGVQTQIAT